MLFLWLIVLCFQPAFSLECNGVERKLGCSCNETAPCAAGYNCRIGHCINIPVLNKHSEASGPIDEEQCTEDCQEKAHCVRVWPSGKQCRCGPGYTASDDGSCQENHEHCRGCNMSSIQPWYAWDTQVTPDRASWYNGRMACQKRQLHLPVLKGEAMRKDFIRTVVALQPHIARSDGIVLGLFYHTKDRRWYWEDGSPAELSDVPRPEGRAGQCGALNLTDASTFPIDCVFQELSVVCQSTIVEFPTGRSLSSSACGGDQCEIYESCLEVYDCEEANCPSRQTCVSFSALTCRHTSCTAGSECVMVAVQCEHRSCHPQPRCRQAQEEAVTKPGECPQNLPHLTSAPQHCSEDRGDAGCPGDMKCCKPLPWYPAACLSPEAGNSCENLKCPFRNDPVCGSNDITYLNQCELDKAACTSPGLTTAHQGPCCTKYCPPQNSPVCGSNDVTYSNQCELYKAACVTFQSISIAHEGPCCNENCPTEVALVCGSDGETYNNTCLLELHACTNNLNIIVRNQGPCCDTYCPPEYSPVCGTDGLTYNNECTLRQTACRSSKDTTVAHPGVCCNELCPDILAPVCGSDGITYKNECELKAVACKTNEEISVVRSGECCPLCTEHFAPVCGSDGTTYTNECQLRLANCQTGGSVMQVSNGACDNPVNLSEFCTPACGTNSYCRPAYPDSYSCECFNGYSLQGGVCTQRAECPSGFISYPSDPPQDKMFGFHHTVREWPVARDICKYTGGRLLQLQTEEEEAIVLSLSNRNPLLNERSHLWLGLFRHSDGQWYWIDGTPLSATYINWRVGHPSEDVGCAALNLVQQVWESVDCEGGSLSILCECTPFIGVMDGTCDGVLCPFGQTCDLRMPDCYVPPCPLQPVCVSESADSCDFVSCNVGEECEVVQTDCIAPPCPMEAQCMPRVEESDQCAEDCDDLEVCIPVSFSTYECRCMLSFYHSEQDGCQPTISFPADYTEVAGTEVAFGSFLGAAVEHNIAFNVADDECRSVRSTLPVIRSQAEQDALVTVLTDSGAELAITDAAAADETEARFWLGLFKHDNEEPWYWVDGTVLGDDDFNLWVAGEPLAENNCAVLLLTVADQYMWRSVRCEEDGGELAYTICQSTLSDLTSVPYCPNIQDPALCTGCTPGVYECVSNDQCGAGSVCCRECCKSTCVPNIPQCLLNTCNTACQPDQTNVCSSDSDCPAAGEHCCLSCCGLTACSPYVHPLAPSPVEDTELSECPLLSGQSCEAFQCQSHAFHQCRSDLDCPEQHACCKGCCENKCITLKPALGICPNNPKSCEGLTCTIQQECWENNDCGYAGVCCRTCCGNKCIRGLPQCSSAVSCPGFCGPHFGNHHQCATRSDCSADHDCCVGCCGMSTCEKLSESAPDCPDRGDCSHQTCLARDECVDDSHCNPGATCCRGCCGNVCRTVTPSCPDQQNPCSYFCRFTLDQCQTDSDCKASETCCSNCCGKKECKTLSHTSIEACPHTTGCDLAACASQAKPIVHQCQSDADCQEHQTCCRDCCENICVPTAPLLYCPNVAADCSLIRCAIAHQCWKNSDCSEGICCRDCCGNRCLGNLQRCSNKECQPGLCPVHIAHQCASAEDCPEHSSCCVDCCGRSVCSRDDVGVPAPIATCQPPPVCPAVNCNHIQQRHQCYTDSDCPTPHHTCCQSCCTNICQESLVPTCADINCGEDEECILEEIECLVPPCYPIPICVEKQVSEPVCTCPRFFSSSLTGCYYISKYKATWRKAKRFCESLGGYLLRVETEEEDRHLQEQIDELNAGSAWLDAAAMLDCEQGEVDNSNCASYTNFPPRSPPWSYVPSSYCLSTEKGSWSITRCSARLTAACEASCIEVDIGRSASTCSNCDSNAQCINGECKCNRGYSGNGVVCEKEPVGENTCRCPPDFQQIKDSCYYISETKHQYEDAVKLCSKKEAAMLQIESQEEQLEVAAVLKNKGIASAWLGGKYHDAVFGYKWNDGGQFMGHYSNLSKAYNNFFDYLPEEIYQRQCVSMRSPDYGWAQTSCESGNYTAVCEVGCIEEVHGRASNDGPALVARSSFFQHEASSAHGLLTRSSFSASDPVFRCGDEMCEKPGFCFIGVCSCPRGTTNVVTGEWNHRVVKCLDINECIEYYNLCGDQAVCINTPGSYYCMCKKGFYVPPGGYECEPYSGCHDCDDHAYCYEYFGIHRCICHVGYQGNGHRCYDVNECALGSHRCDVNALCTNTDGGHACSCIHGYTGDGYTCLRMSGSSFTLDMFDDCSPHDDECSHNEACIKVMGSPMCVCVPPLKKQDGRCVGVQTSCAEECHGYAGCIPRTPNSTWCRCADGMYGDGKDFCSVKLIHPPSLDSGSFRHQFIYKNGFQLDWEMSHSFCSRLNTRLPVIKNIRQQMELRRFARLKGLEYIPIGLFRYEPLKGMFWINGDALLEEGYSNWGEDNNSTDTSSACVGMKVADGVWTMMPCSQQPNTVLCESTTVQDVACRLLPHIFERSTCQ